MPVSPSARMENCGVPTITCVLLLLFTGALYASAEDDDLDLRSNGDLESQALVRIARRAQRPSLSNSWIGVHDRARSGRISDEGGENNPTVGRRPRPSGSRGRPRPGEEQPIGGGGRRGRNRGGRGRNRNRNRNRDPDRGRGSRHGNRRPTNPTRLDRRTMGLVYRLSNASTPFALKLFSKLHQPQLTADTVFSPHSVHAAMTMTSLGARGRTQREITKALGLKQVRLRRMREHRAYHALLSSLSYTHRDVHILSANAVFVKPNIPLEATFRQHLQHMYLAKFSSLNTTAPEHFINSYVANITRNKITDLIAPGSINPLTAMILINAIYLNASWARPFDSRMTRQEEFDSLTMGRRNVQMMENTQVYRYADHHNAQVVELPYKGDRLAMYILLPHASSSIHELMTFVTNVQNRRQDPLDKITQNMNPTFVKLLLPKFKVEGDLLDLSQHLKDLGISRAFSENRANFTGISIAPLYIEKVVHKAVIEVKETGTTASAATAVYFNLRSSFRPRNTTDVRVDRPFMFFIKDKLMNSVLFLGAYTGQTSEEVSEQ